MKLNFQHLIKLLHFSIKSIQSKDLFVKANTGNSNENNINILIIL